MKICFIASGEIEIPPKNWGALESVVWQLSQELKLLGHDVLIVNELDIFESEMKIREFNPDILHLHYGKHYELMPKFNCKKFATSYDGSFEVSKPFHYGITQKHLYDCSFVCLREYEKKFFIQAGISPSKIKYLPLGVDHSLFKRKIHNPNKGDRSLYLGKIDWRKRQNEFQHKNLNIDFVGPNSCPIFDAYDPCYLGVWSQQEKYDNLTEYGNLVLLSVSENGNPPLVCLEAMSAGLGIVISEASNEYLDLSRKFITVIPNAKIHDYDFLNKAIRENRDYSVKNREEIIEYVSSRSWKHIAEIYNSFLA